MEEASGTGGPPQPVLPPSEPLDASLSDASDSGPDKARPSSDSQDDAQAPQQGEEEEEGEGEKEGEGGGERTTGVRFAIPPPPPERSESNSSTGDSTSMQPLNSPERGYRKRGQVRRTYI